MNTWTFCEKKWGNKKKEKKEENGKTHVTPSVANWNAQRLIRKHAKKKFNIV